MVINTRIAAVAAMAVTALAVAACSGGSGYGDDDTPAPQPNRAPTISAVADRSIDQDKTDAGITFDVGDTDGNAGAVTLTAQSSDSALLPAGSLVLGGSGTSRTLSVTPAENATGTATVTLTATDPQQLSASRSFRVTVNPVFVSFTGWTTDTFTLSEDEVSIALLGFTLNSDADDVDAPFDALVQ
jgi:hypothetical protein